MIKPQIATRNPIARSPLLRKGGAHVKSKTGQRVRQRMSIQSLIDEWQDEVNDNDKQMDREQMLPDLLLQTFSGNLSQYCFN